MDWIDYREKLGIAFSDTQKYEHFKKKIFNYLDNWEGKPNYNEYVNFCDMTGSIINPHCLTQYDDKERYEHIIDIIRRKSDTISDFFAYYMAFVNTREYLEWRDQGKASYKDLLCKMLNESHIPFEILEDDDGCFVFPKGAKELDQALVSEPLEWLNSYPIAHKAFIKALKDYANATEDTASNVADKFRKALESFCQEFFGGQKSLENYKSDVGRFLKDNGVPKEISGNFETILNSYCLFINNYAKHRDATSDKLLEFIMYQTGNFIRLLITFKGSSV